MEGVEVGCATRFNSQTRGIFVIFSKMPRWCAAYNCSNASHKLACKNVSFHIFPNDPDLRRQWILATKRKSFNPGKFSYLCSDHFSLESFVPDISVRKLFPNAVPISFESLPKYFQPTTKRRAVSERRLFDQSIRQVITSSESTGSTSLTDPTTPPVSSPSVKDKSTQTLPDYEKIEFQEKISILKSKLAKARLRH